MFVTQLINRSPSDAIYGASTRTIVFGDDISAAGLIENSPVVFTTNGEQYTVYVKAINQNTDNCGYWSVSFLYRHLRLRSTDATLEAAGIDLITDTGTGNYVPETNPNGSAYAKWISKDYQSENPCDGIELKLSAIFYTEGKT